MCLRSALVQSGSIYRSGFGPLMGGVFVAQFPYLTRGPYAPAQQRHQDPSWAQSVDQMHFYGAAPEEVSARDVQRCLDSVELMLRTQTSAHETVSHYEPMVVPLTLPLRCVCVCGIWLDADSVRAGGMCVHSNAVDCVIRDDDGDGDGGGDVGQACIMVEPVLGEGGYLPCPPGYLKGLRDICDR
jgi:hypothetical protein